MYGGVVETLHSSVGVQGKNFKKKRKIPQFMNLKGAVQGVGGSSEEVGTSMARGETLLVSR